MREVSGNLDLGCFADCNHDPAQPATLGSPLSKYSADSSANPEEHRVFSQNFFLHPQTSKPLKEPNPPVYPVLFFEVLPGRFMGMGVGGDAM